MIVTSIQRKPRRRLVDVYVDGEFALALGRELAAERGLRAGIAITPGELTALRVDQARRSAIETALRLLSYRPRSERELRDRLFRKAFDRATVGATLARMRELGYLDDAEFARFWTETRQAAGPRSKRLLASELRGRGIDRRLAEEATAEVADEEAAYEAASRRLRALGGLEYGRFRERLGAFLTRRGFSYEVARGTIDRCWQELQNGPAGA